MRKSKLLLMVILLFMMIVMPISGIGGTTSEAAGKGKYFTAGKLYYHTLSGSKVEVCGTKKTNGTLTIPANVTYKGKKYRVTKIADYEIYSQSGISENNGSETNITVGDGLYYRYDRVDGKSMPGNVDWIAGSGITRVVLPGSITYIGNGAFNGCSKLKTVNFAKSYKKLTVGENAFGGTKLKSLVFPKGTYELKDGAAGTVSDITIPASVKKIGAGVVNYKMKKIIINKKNSNFKMKNGIMYSKDEKVLYGASSKAPKRIKISAKTTKIMAKAFYNTKASEIILNDRISYIPEGAFCGCAGLVNVGKTHNITSIGYGAFADCPKLQDIGSMRKLESIERAAFWKDKCLKLNISKTAKNVSDYAFSGTEYQTMLKAVNVAAGNSKLSIIDGFLVKTEGAEKTVVLQISDTKKIKVPEGITRIAVCLGNYTCEEISLPATLMVQDGRFRLNNGSVTFNGGKVPEFGAEFGMFGVKTVYVPKSKLDEYRNAMDAVVEKRDDTKLFDEDFGTVIRGY